MAKTERLGLNMRIAIGADHGGFLLKQKLIKYLELKGFVVADVGAHSDMPCDYPVYGAKVARLISDREFDRGILICKSGLGMSMTANKFKGVRAALCWDAAGARSSREHNDANVLCLAAKKTAFKPAKKILDAWLSTDFTGGRHLRRVKQITKFEDEACRR